MTFFNKRNFNAVMNDLTKNRGLSWITGFMTFIMGAVVIALYNTWTWDWRVIVTLLGWVTVIKGAVIMVFPRSMAQIYERVMSDRMLMFSGIYALTLGALLLGLGLMK
jgi:uncharacterized protein YjeT (DUF2065 family)